MGKIRPILLAGASAAGKSTLARCIGRATISTSQRLREVAVDRGLDTREWKSDDWFRFGSRLDKELGHWMWKDVDSAVSGVRALTVDSIRSDDQLMMWESGGLDPVLVNVKCSGVELDRRHIARETSYPKYEAEVFHFVKPHYTWHSDLVPVGAAARAVAGIAGEGYVDVVVGAQYGSEGKGKLCSLIAGGYDALVRSGGPNAGHWVREEEWEYCFHSIPSGALSNRNARLYVAAGASLDVARFEDETTRTQAWHRLVVDDGVMSVTEEDKASEKQLARDIGSTAQGVGAALVRRLSRNPQKRDDILSATSRARVSDGSLGWVRGNVSRMLHQEVQRGNRVMLEGTQGSGLSIYHGTYPFVTTRDTNVAGILSEVGIAPAYLRDVWMVVRSYPIRTGGNSGPMRGETDWSSMEDMLGLERGLLHDRERTSTTNRIRRVARFDGEQFQRACELNRPTKLFITFADYVDPEVARVRDWGKLASSTSVLMFMAMLEAVAQAPVVGVSTGRMNADVAWRPGYEPEKAR